MNEIYNSDCLEALKELKDNSIDSLVTDPPAGISFMNKDWDKNKGGRDSWIDWMSTVMKEVLRVLKPGAHGFVWAIPRTSHWTATALENAGFEIRDVVTHLFGSGFPKSHNISKAIDKKMGKEREVVGFNKKSPSFSSPNTNTDSKDWNYGNSDHTNKQPITKPSTDQAKQWDGWGTALKPASEHWILVRKPFKCTVVDNILRHGTGGINIDESRVEVDKEDPNWRPNDTVQTVCETSIFGIGGGKFRKDNLNTQGRFPANLILDEEAGEMLDEQSGVLGNGYRPNSDNHNATNVYGRNSLLESKTIRKNKVTFNDKGGASRFFYTAKASKRERGEGNSHPTVKPLKLMQYLIKMITPKDGTVLDPFMGSGTTGVAALDLGYDFIGIEQSEEYYKIANNRIENIKLEQMLKSTA